MIEPTKSVSLKVLMTFSLPHLQEEMKPKVNFLKEKGALYCFFWNVSDRDMELRLGNNERQ